MFTSLVASRTLNALHPPLLATPTEAILNGADSTTTPTPPRPALAAWRIAASVVFVASVIVPYALAPSHYHQLAGWTSLVLVASSLFGQYLAFSTVCTGRKTGYFGLRGNVFGAFGGLVLALIVGFGLTVLANAFMADQAAAYQLLVELLGGSLVVGSFAGLLLSFLLVPTARL